MKLFETMTGKDSNTSSGKRQTLLRDARDRKLWRGHDHPRLEGT